MCTGIQGYLFGIVGSRAVCRLRAKLFTKLLHQPPAFHDMRNPGVSVRFNAGQFSLWRPVGEAHLTNPRAALAGGATAPQTPPKSRPPASPGRPKNRPKSTPGSTQKSTKIDPRVNQKSTKSRPKVDQKSTKSRPKVDKKSTKSRPKVNQKSTKKSTKKLNKSHQKS